ncbi:hypothetical protein FRB99_008742 [Tulasnella sp. 403]|nr:hypothetical protein FRB99_008742 [Tulasnella sp. 403]
MVYQRINVYPYRRASYPYESSLAGPSSLVLPKLSLHEIADALMSVQHTIDSLKAKLEEFDSTLLQLRERSRRLDMDMLETQRKLRDRFERAEHERELQKQDGWMQREIRRNAYIEER